MILSDYLHPRNVVAGASRALFNLSLASEILFVGTDTQVEAGNLHPERV